MRPTSSRSREKVNNKVSPSIRRANKKGCNHPLGVCDCPRTHQQFPYHSQFSIFRLELDGPASQICSLSEFLTNARSSSSRAACTSPPSHFSLTHINHSTSA